MLQLGGEQYLLLETLKIHAGREIGRKHFHHDPARESALLGQKHATHSTAAEFALYAIGAGQRGLQPASKIGLQVPRMTRSRPEGGAGYGVGISGSTEPERRRAMGQE